MVCATGTRCPVTSDGPKIILSCLEASVCARGGVAGYCSLTHSLVVSFAGGDCSLQDVARRFVGGTSHGDHVCAAARGPRAACLRSWSWVKWWRRRRRTPPSKGRLGPFVFRRPPKKCDSHLLFLETAKGSLKNGRTPLAFKR